MTATAENTLKSCIRQHENDVIEFVAQRAAADLTKNCSNLSCEPNDGTDKLLLACELQTRKVQQISKLLTQRAEQLLSDLADEEKRGTSLRVELQSGTELDGIGAHRASTSDSMTTASCSRSTIDLMLKSVTIEIERATMRRSESLDLDEHFRLLKLKLQVVVDLLCDKEHTLRTSCLIPTSLMEAEQFESDHRKFQKSLAKTQETVDFYVQTAHLLLQSLANKDTRTRAVNGASLEHAYAHEAESVQQSTSSSSVHDKTTTQRHVQNLSKRATVFCKQLVSHAEERQTLIVASLNWYRTKEQVFSLLNLLLQQYQRPDWCPSTEANMDERWKQMRASMLQHLEQKETFLKACMLARKMADSFRTHPGYSDMLATAADGSRNSLIIANIIDRSAKVSRTLEQFFELEKTVLEAWCARKKQFEQFFIMTELLNTERTYIKDLETCIKTYLRAFTDPKTARLVPAELQGQEQLIFINIPAILSFHKNTFLPDLEACESRPQDVGVCFVEWYETLTNMYAEYCVGKQKSNEIITAYGIEFFDEVQDSHQLQMNISSYLIKPTQRISKYHLLLNELNKALKHDQQSKINEGLQVMLNVMNKVNEAVHLTILGDAVTSKCGRLLLQDRFTVWNWTDMFSKKARERRVFLFDNCLLFTKERRESGVLVSYTIKRRFDLRSVGITEPMKDVIYDECKFAILLYTSLTNVQHRVELKACNLETKELWMKTIREMVLGCLKASKNALSPSAFGSMQPALNSASHQTSYSHENSSNRSLALVSKKICSVHNFSICCFGPHTSSN